MSNLYHDGQEVTRLVKAAWLAGFMSSAEGYNGEYPFEGEEPDERLLARADAYVAALSPNPLPKEPSL